MSQTPLAPTVFRRLQTDHAVGLAELAAVLGELQVVMQCCERLLVELATDVPDPVVLEGVWTTALLSYARCFPGAGRVGLAEDDLATVGPHEDVLTWHRMLLQLRDHYGGALTNPREQFSVAVTQTDDGRAGGVAVSSAREPDLDELTVRQTGAVAFALGAVVDARMTAQQQLVLEDALALTREDLEALVALDVRTPEQTPDPTPDPTWPDPT